MAREPVGSVDDRAGEGLEEPPLEVVAQSRDARLLRLALEPGDARRLAEPDDPSDVERARTAPALVPSALDLLRNAHARPLAPQVERADPLRPVELVRGVRQEVDACRVDVERFLAERLRRVGVKERPMLAAERADLSDRVSHAGLVVGAHERNEACSAGELRAQRVEVDSPLAVDAEAHDLEALPFEPGERIEHRVVLRRAL